MDSGVVEAFQGQSFTTRTGVQLPVLNAVLAVYDRSAPIRILDIGCAKGDLLFQIAEHYHNATLIGVDLSAGNIQVATEHSRSLGLAQRSIFIGGDYLAIAIEPVDLIVSDSTLHLIDADPLDVHRKVCRDLKSGGCLVACVPFACAFNTTLIFVRRVLRALRGRITDRSIEAVARLLEGRNLSSEMIRERVVYMYVVPSFLAGSSFDRRLAQIGLTLEKILPYPHASIAQPKHRIGVYRHG